MCKLFFNYLMFAIVSIFQLFQLFAAGFPEDRNMLINTIFAFKLNYFGYTNFCALDFALE